MKILDRYILTTYLKTFLSVFVILMFIFVLQTVWLYISELAGKDLDITVVGKFLLYFSPKLIPLVLPLTILLASIMVFGNFAENYEFAAMKSNGISLQRAMRSLSWFIFILGGLAFLFANSVIPAAELKSYNLRKNIAKVKPAMAIAEGQFNDIGDINIKVDEKSGDRGQYLKGVVIHKKKPTKKGNYTVIIAEDGELISSEDSNILQLELLNGNYYDELVNKDVRKYINNKPHAQSTFEKYIINVDLEGLNDIDMDEEKSDKRYNMLNVSGLNYFIDSLYVDRKNDYNDLSKTLYNRSTFDALSLPLKISTDSIYEGDNLMDLYSNDNKLQILNLALNTIKNTKQVLTTNKSSFETRKSWLNRHVIALHEKYVLAFACIILFFIGAPLGALIRKGGLGLPLVIAILLFLSYHFIGLFAKNSAKDGTINPIFGTWLSTLITLPLSIYLTSRATKDRGLFEIDFITVPLKKFFKFETTSDHDNIQNVQSYSYYRKYSNEQLVEVIKNQKAFDLDKKPKQIALQHLSDRHLSLDTQAEYGLNIPDTIKTAERLLKDFKDYSKTTLISYCIAVIFIVLHFVFKNNKLPELAISIKDLAFVSLVFFSIYIIVSTILYRKFYSILNLTQKRVKPFLILLGLPFYPIKYLFFNRNMKRHFHLACLEEIN